MFKFLMLMILITKGDIYSLKEFQSRLFKIKNYENKFYELKDPITIKSKNGEVVMAYFLTKNLITNILTMNSERNMINAKIYDEKKYIYENLYTFNLLKEIKNLSKDEKIKSINLINLYDDDIYFFMITENNDKSKIYLLKYSDKKLNYIENKELENLQFTNQPIFFQQVDKQNMKVTTFFILNFENERKVYYFDIEKNKFFPKKFDEFVVTDKNCKSIPNHNIDYHHSSSFLDIDGDCKSDLIINSSSNDKNYLEIYLNKNDKFCLLNVIEYEKHYSLPNYINLRQTGLVDIAILDKKNMSLKVLFNKYSKNNSLCKINHSYKFPFNSNLKGEVKNKKYYYEKNLNLSDYSFEKKPFNFPYFPRFGDLFLSGKYDLILNLYNKKDKKFETIILQNNSEMKDKKFEIKFEKMNKVLEKSYEKLGFQTSLFDFAEKGKLGLIVNYKDSDGNYFIKSYFNNLNSDNYFLKTITFDNKKLNNYMNGVNYQFERSFDDEKSAILSDTQNKLIQSNFLNPLFCHFGLGNINNYIKKFKIGINNDSNEYSKEWNLIIPNSQLILYLNYGKSFWHLDIIINPTEAMIFIIISTVIILVILGSIILFLHLKEKKEDIKNNSEILPYL